MSDILFEITKNQLETGMRGFPVGYCTTSSIDPIKGLFYREHSVFELYEWEPERVLYLLMYGEDGSFEKIASFKAELKKRGNCSNVVIRHIESLPRQACPMKLFNAALLILGMFEGQNNYREDCLNLIAKLPHLVAVVINYHAGWGETPHPDCALGYMENFSYMVRTPDADPKQLGEAFRLFNLLHYDHGGGNLSTFVGKAIASGLEEMYGTICGAMCALAGARHGKANQECFNFIQALLDKLGPAASENDIEEFLIKKIENEECIVGFGHAVLRAEDARATILYDYVQKRFKDHDLVKIAMHLRNVGVKVLKDNSKTSNPYPNVDAISGTLLAVAGFPYSEYFTVLFGLARCIGVSIQIVYERLETRGGRGTPIIRPKYFYKGS